MRTGSDIEAMLLNSFHLPPAQLRMPLRGEVAAAVRRHPNCPTGAMLLVSDGIVRRDTLVDMVGQRVKFPDGPAFDRCLVVLVDPTPTAAWAHPAWWAFVPTSLEGIELRSTDLPEHPKGSVRLLLCDG